MHSRSESAQIKSFQMINPNTLYNPTAFAYSHVAEVRHYLRILHISGQGGENQQGQLSQDFAQQVHQAFSPDTELIPVHGKGSGLSQRCQILC